MTETPFTPEFEKPKVVLLSKSAESAKRIIDSCCGPVDDLLAQIRERLEAAGHRPTVGVCVQVKLNDEEGSWTDYVASSFSDDRPGVRHRITSRTTSETSNQGNTSILFACAFGLGVVGIFDLLLWLRTHSLMNAQVGAGLLLLAGVTSALAILIGPKKK